MKHEQGHNGAAQDTAAPPQDEAARGGQEHGEPQGKRGLSRTRVGAAWAAVLVAIVVLVFLLVFILQNLETTTVAFLGLSGSLPLAVAMLFAAIAGAALVGLLGVARMIQLRREQRKARGTD